MTSIFYKVTLHFYCYNWDAQLTFSFIVSYWNRSPCFASIADFFALPERSVWTHLLNISRRFAFSRSCCAMCWVICIWIYAIPTNNSTVDTACNDRKRTSEERFLSLRSSFSIFADFINPYLQWLKVTSKFAYSRWPFAYGTAVVPGNNILISIFVLLIVTAVIYIILQNPICLSYYNI